MKIFLSVSVFLLFMVGHVLAQSVGKASADVAYYCPLCNSSCDTLVFKQAGVCAHCGMTLVKRTRQERVAELKREQIAVCFYLQDGIEVLDFAGPMEVFSYAGFKVFTVSKTKDPIVSQGILKVVPDYSIADAPEAQILAFFSNT